MKTHHKRIAILSSSAAALVIAGLLHAQGTDDEIDRPPFFTNDIRLQRGAVLSEDDIDNNPKAMTAVAYEGTDSVNAPAPLAPGIADDRLPPMGVKVGECYAQVLVEAKMIPVSDRVMTKEASYELVEIPAEFEMVEQRVMTKAAYERQEVIPATYKKVEEKILKRPGYTRQVPVPPVYETRTEKVMVKPERVYWTEGEDPITDLDNPTSEIMCLVREPAEYKQVSKRVLVTPASTREEIIPAEYETYTRTVVDRPAQVKTIKVPAVYETRKVRQVISPATTERREIVAQYDTVDRMVAEGESRIEWRRVLCETNATPEVVAEIQTKLNEHGYEVDVDGELDRKTRSAIRDFQEDNNLALAGVSYASMDALGVKR